MINIRSQSIKVPNISSLLGSDLTLKLRKGRFQIHKVVKTHPDEQTHMTATMVQV